MDGEPKFNQQETTRRIEIETFITHRSWRRYLAQFQGLHREVSASYREKEAGPGAHAFIRVSGWSALGFPS